MMVLDPSDKFRPERDEAEFRNYTADNEYHERVRRTYYEMHTNMTVDYVRKQVERTLPSFINSTIYKKKPHIVGPRPPILLAIFLAGTL